MQYRAMTLIKDGMTCMPRCKLTDCTRPRVLSQTYKNDNHSLGKQKCLFASLVKHMAKSEAFSSQASVRGTSYWTSYILKIHSVFFFFFLQKQGTS